VYDYKIVRVNRELCYLSGCKLNPKTLKQEFLIIVSFNKPENAQQDYQKRWQIEMCFKAMKSSGFDIEKMDFLSVIYLLTLVLNQSNYFCVSLKTI
jgi:IS4 transposase